MARGARAMVFAQAVLVWGLGKINGWKWIQYGSLGKTEPRRWPPSLLRKKEEIQEYMATHNGDWPPEILAKGAA